MQSILIHRFHISESFSLKFIYNTKIILAQCFTIKNICRASTCMFPAKVKQNKALLFVFSKQVPSM